jgi:hypothetical protein
MRESRGRRGGKSSPPVMACAKSTSEAEEKKYQARREAFRRYAAKRRPADSGDAIARQDASIFTRISGVGTKTAEKIIVELKNKVGAVSGSGASSEVFDALVALGYSQKEVREAVGKLNSDTTTGEQIKEALKLLGKG